MTGFGRAETAAVAYHIVVELRTLNSKFLDLHLRIPAVMRNREFLMRTILADKVMRGKTDCFIHIDFNKSIQSSLVNKTTAIQYYHEFKNLAMELNEHTFNALGAALQMPDVIDTERRIDDEPLWKDVKSLLENALAGHEEFRIQEGLKLQAELETLVHRIETLAEEAIQLDSMRIKNIRERLHTMFTEAGFDEKVDQSRFEQEMIYYLERIDFTEEKVRLLTHCNYFLQTLTDTQSNGRKLGFIAQEMGREINTMGSKAHDAAIQQRVVMMKDELEKIKEQLMNVL